MAGYGLGGLRTGLPVTTQESGGGFKSSEAVDQMMGDVASAAVLPDEPAFEAGGVGGGQSHMHMGLSVLVPAVQHLPMLVQPRQGAPVRQVHAQFQHLPGPVAPQL